MNWDDEAEFEPLGEYERDMLDRPFPEGFPEWEFTRPQTFD